MNPVKTPSTNPNPQRDAQGKFVKGNAGGPGNPFGRHLGRARCKWNSLATPEHVENVYKAVYEKACGGCVAAMKLYLLYLLGKPNPMPNPDHVDLEEYGLYEKATRMLKRSPDVMTSPDHSFALEIARTARPAMAEEARKQMLERFEEAAEEEREIDESIKEMEREYDRQQARKRRSAAKRSAKRGAKKQRRANAKRQTKPASPTTHSGKKVACVSRSPHQSAHAKRQAKILPPRGATESAPGSTCPKNPAPLKDGFFPPPAPLNNGFAGDREPESNDG